MLEIGTSHCPSVRSLEEYAFGNSVDLSPRRSLPCRCTGRRQAPTQDQQQHPGPSSRERMSPLCPKFHICFSLIARFRPALSQPVSSLATARLAAGIPGQPVVLTPFYPLLSAALSPPGMEEQPARLCAHRRMLFSICLHACLLCPRHSDLRRGHPRPCARCHVINILQRVHPRPF